MRCRSDPVIWFHLEPFAPKFCFLYLDASCRLQLGVPPLADMICLDSFCTDVWCQAPMVVLNRFEGDHFLARILWILGIPSKKDDSKNRIRFYSYTSHERKGVTRSQSPSRTFISAHLNYVLPFGTFLSKAERLPFERAIYILRIGQILGTKSFTDEPRIRSVRCPDYCWW